MTFQVKQRLPNKPVLLTTNNRAHLNKKSFNQLSSSKSILKTNQSDGNLDPNQKIGRPDEIKNFSTNHSTNIDSHSIPPKIFISNEQFYNTNLGSNNEIILSDNNSHDHHDYFISDSILGEKIRKIFKEKSDSDSIYDDIKLLIDFIESMKTEQNINIESIVNDIKKQLFEYSQLQIKYQNLEMRLKKHQNKNDDDQSIVKTVKSYYNEFKDSKKIIHLFECDFTFVSKVKNIFNQSDNYEAILRTIQSNKETAKDNKIISELTLQLQELSKDGLAIKEKALSQKIQNQFQQEINKLIQTIDDLKNQNRILNSTIENLMVAIEYYQKSKNVK